VPFFSKKNPAGLCPKAAKKGVTYLLLVFGVSFPLSAEAFETFGPMHIPIATKGYENLFVALVKE